MGSPNESHFWDQPTSPISVDVNNTPVSINTYGSLAYVKSGAYMQNGRLWQMIADDILIKDGVTFWPASGVIVNNTNSPTMRTCVLTAGTGQNLQNATSFQGESSGYSIASAWCGGSACSTSNHNVYQSSSPGTLYSGTGPHAEPKACTIRA